MSLAKRGDCKRVGFFSFFVYISFQPPVLKTRENEFLLSWLWSTFHIFTRTEIAKAANGTKALLATEHSETAALIKPGTLCNAATLTGSENRLHCGCVINWSDSTSALMTPTSKQSLQREGGFNKTRSVIHDADSRPAQYSEQALK